MMRAATYRKGDVILHEGHRGTEAFVIERGRVEVFRPGPPELSLAVFGPGEIFGEMALITDKPRSASVRALEEVELGVLARDEFLEHLRTAPDALLPFLRALSERIRNLTSLVEELSRRSPAVREVVRVHLGVAAPVEAPGGAGTLGPRVTIEGLTPHAKVVVGRRPAAIERFPYRIGRMTDPDDPFAANELVIPDRDPSWVSRNHCMLVEVDGRCFLVDRGSRLGTLVDGTMVGGNHQTGRVELRRGRHELWIGGALTPFRFAVTVGREDGADAARPAARARGRAATTTTRTRSQPPRRRGRGRR
jgi:hypothetical protein